MEYWFPLILKLISLSMTLKSVLLMGRQTWMALEILPTVKRFTRVHPVLGSHWLVAPTFLAFIRKAGFWKVQATLAFATQFQAIKTFFKTILIDALSNLVRKSRSFFFLLYYFVDEHDSSVLVNRRNKRDSFLGGCSLVEATFEMKIKLQFKAILPTSKRFYSWEWCPFSESWDGTRRSLF